MRSILKSSNTCKEYLLHSFLKPGYELDSVGCCWVEGGVAPLGMNSHDFIHCALHMSHWWTTDTPFTLPQ